MPAPPARIGSSESHEGRGSHGGNHEARELPHPSSLVRDPSSRGGVRYQDHPGASGPQGCEHHHDLHARPQQRRTRRAKSTGHSSMSPTAPQQAAFIRLCCNEVASHHAAGIPEAIVPRAVAPPVLFSEPSPSTGISKAIGLSLTYIWRWAGGSRRRGECRYGRRGRRRAGRRCASKVLGCAGSAKLSS